VVLSIAVLLDELLLLVDQELLGTLAADVACFIIIILISERSVAAADKILRFALLNGCVPRFLLRWRSPHFVLVTVHIGEIVH